MLVRTWNVFHGNAVPPERRGFLREMVELVSADGPDVVFLQELPAWAFGHLEAWSGMQSFCAIGARPALLNAQLGRVITAFNHGLLRSAVTGEGVAILVARRHAVTPQPPRAIGHRRAFLSVRFDDGLLAGCFHLWASAVANEQFRRIVELVDDEPRVILGGDVNLRPPYGQIEGKGFSEPLADSIDQVLVRGMASMPAHAWPAERRRIAGRLMSDHAPVEADVG